MQDGFEEILREASTEMQELAKHTRALIKEIMPDVVEVISSKNGIDILEIEVLNISTHGIWLFVKGKEYSLSYQDYPWFKESKVPEICEVELLHDSHLHWPQLDIDLEIEILDNPGKYPLK